MERRTLKLKRTTPSTPKTRAPKPEAFEEILSFKHDTNSRPITPNKIIALSRVIGNHHMQGLIKGALTPARLQIQRMKELGPVDRVPLENTAKMHGWSPDELTAIIKWAKNIEQVRSILMKCKRVDWLLIQEYIPDGAGLKITDAAAILRLANEKKVSAAAAAEQKKMNDAAAAEQKRVADAAAAEQKKKDQEAKDLKDFTSNYGPPATAKKYVSLIKLTHKSTYKTADEIRQTVQGFGPFSRSFGVTVNGVAAGWVIHIHYNGLKFEGTPALHVKLVGSELSKDVKRKVVPDELKQLVTILREVDLQNKDWTIPERQFLNPQK